jgi:hypothetical protein
MKMKENGWTYYFVFKNEKETGKKCWPIIIKLD